MPKAAERPWQVARACVGKISEGMMKVVVLGPKSRADGWEVKCEIGPINWPLAASNITQKCCIHLPSKKKVSASDLKGIGAVR